VGLGDDLSRIAAAAGAFGEVGGVLAAEPSPGRRVYLVAFEADGSGDWLLLDDAAVAVAQRETVREAASIIALCELAADVAGGGDIPGLRARLAQLRAVENPPGIAAAEAAAAALADALGIEPRVASPGYLDAVGLATRDLERVLGETTSPFTAALKAGTAAVDEFVRDVERRYAVPLR
jgi:hypothetical protein